MFEHLKPLMISKASVRRLFPISGRIPVELWEFAEVLFMYMRSRNDAMVYALWKNAFLLLAPEEACQYLHLLPWYFADEPFCVPQRYRAFLARYTHAPSLKSLSSRCKIIRDVREECVCELCIKSMRTIRHVENYTVHTATRITFVADALQFAMDCGNYAAVAYMYRQLPKYERALYAEVDMQSIKRIASTRRMMHAALRISGHWRRYKLRVVNGWIARICYVRGLTPSIAHVIAMHVKKHGNRDALE